MAKPISQNVQIPKFVVVSSYTVDRIGEFPNAHITQVECAYLMDGPGVLASFDNGILAVPAFADLTNLEGRKLVLPDSTEVGTIAGAERTVLSPEVRDEHDNVTHVATYTMHLTLTAAPLVTLTPTITKLGVARRTPVGAPAYREMPNARKWHTQVPGTSPAGMARIGQMMGAIMFAAIKAGCEAMSVQKTDAEILAAVQQLASVGINIDSFIADQAEALEVDRLAGAVPFVLVEGNAPSAT